MRAWTITALALGLAFAVGCTEKDPPPDPPTDLAIDLVDGKPHLTWTDNSDNEIHFMIMRQEIGGTGSYAEVGTAPADSMEYMDMAAVSGKMYSYVVMAMGDGGNSMTTNVVDVTIP